MNSTQVGRIRLGIGATLLVAASATCAFAAIEAGQVVKFTRAVVNLESFDGALQEDAPTSVRRAPPKSSKLWFGEIFRQLPADGPTSREHNVPFAVSMDGNVVVRVWSDANMNGDLDDDPAPVLYGVPGEPASRSFLTTLRWSARWAGRSLPIERVVRVIVRAAAAEGDAPDYRIQDVFGMMGNVSVAGTSRRAILFDANHDGRYTRGHGDGAFFDLDGDSKFTIDTLSPDFGPFAIPFSMQGRLVTVDSVAVDGSLITVRDIGVAPTAGSVTPGRAAPDFSFVDTEGRLQRLSAHRGRTTVIYFWASWCASCRGQAVRLRDWMAKPGHDSCDMLGICCDTDREAALHFRHEYGLTWPTSFSGGYTSEDPVARLYREATVGVFYVVGPDGRLIDRVLDVDDVQAGLDKMSQHQGSTSVEAR